MRRINPILFMLAAAGFFIFANSCWANSIIISEIAWMGTTDSTNDEWLELYNPTATEVDLTGWTLTAADDTPKINLSGTIPAGGYFLLERTDDTSVPAVAADQIYSGALGNAGENLTLKDGTGNLIFQLDATAGWPAGNNDTKQTASYDGAAWQSSAHPNGTPKAVNDFAAPAPPETPAAPTPTTPTAPAPAPKSQAVYRAGDVVINEFVSDPADDDVEWLELYNKLPSTVILDDWSLADGAETKTKLSGEILGHNFFVIEKPNGNLNNKGDIIILADAAGEIIDQCSYGNWQDDDLSDNAPAGSDPNSVARITDGYDTNNDFTDFKITATPTKGAANIIIHDEGDPAKRGRLQQYSSSIIINEIFPNPVGADDAEFIEIKNIGSNAVNLDGWQLGDGSTRRFTISNLQIKPGEILIFPRSQTKIALNNSGAEKVILFWPSADVATEISYSGIAPEGKSYSRDENGSWFWSGAVTPGQENEIIKKNEAPTANIFAISTTTPGAIITFDGSDSLDPEDGLLNYFWDFGDGKTDQGKIVYKDYFNAGQYLVTLKVVDEKFASSTATHIITVGEINFQENTAINKGAIDQSRLREEMQQIFISEFLPNPAGSDAELEFIELFNPNNFTVDLSSWILDDAEGGSAPYVFSNGSLIGALQYLLLPRTETGIALNNNGDEVRLIDAWGNIVDIAVYEKSAEGVSIIRDEQGFLQNTKTPTPGEINVLTAAAQAAGVVMVTINDLAEEELNLPVKISGTVLVPPGVLGTQIFYIGGSQGIQIYMYKKDFPELQVGDQVEVSGILTQSQGERRIKITNKEDIKLLGARTEVKPLQSLSSQINEQLDAGLVTVSGEVTESKGSGFYVDDGDGEIYCYIKSATGIKKNFKVGDTVSVTGILTRNENGFRILPRFVNDILVQKVLAAEVGTETGLPDFTLGSGSVNKYLIAAVAALGIIVLGLFLKIKKQA